MPVANPLKKNMKKAQASRAKYTNENPLWKGPEVDGVTQSMLGGFLVCRERFRCRYMLGLKEAPSFNHRTEYGSMWHKCEESLAANPKAGWHSGSPFNEILKNYCQELVTKYRSQQDQIEHWYQVCKMQFPLYVEHWRKHPDVKARKPVAQEITFDVPYTLPSGRVVKLRGRFDSIDLIGGKLYLQENKTKGDIDEIQMQRQLQFDLQSMLYLVALKTGSKSLIACASQQGKEAIGGIRYNVVRRPLSGGKGSIVRHKPTGKNPQGESAESFYDRLRDIIAADLPYFFMRWKVEITSADIAAFEKKCLIPVLEQLCDWYSNVIGDDGTKCFSHLGNNLNFQMPYGVYSPLLDGGSTVLDEYLNTGSEVGLVRVNELFTELK